MKTESNGNKLKHENMNENENVVRKDIGTKKAEALTRLKGIIGDTGKVMTIRGAEGAPDVNVSVLTDKETLREIIEKLGKYRIEADLYLDRETAALVSYLHDYLYELRDFIVRYPKVPAFITGFFVDRDIQIWSDEVERSVIRKMNAANTETEVHSGEEWEEVKHRIYDELDEKSTLHHLMNPPEETASEKDAVWQELIETLSKY